MLMLTRYQGEKTVITLEDGRRIVMQVVELRGNKIRVGWDAPKTIRIDREEIDELRNREQIA